MRQFSTLSGFKVNFVTIGLCIVIESFYFEETEHLNEEGLYNI